MCWNVWCDNINSRANRPIAKNITVSIASPWVPTRVFCIKISKEKGSIIMGENSIEFRDIIGAQTDFQRASLYLYPSRIIRERPACVIDLEICVFLY
ncbi:hypothetical protein TNCV_1221041 [Trichonephila clavipes]|nr:hypothetical protein TNCV_1221041 [Trichonephila clavipes]